MFTSSPIQRQFNHHTPAFDFCFEIDQDTGNSSESSGRSFEDRTGASDSGRRYPCPFPDCSQRFKRRYTLKDHINAHTGEKPFVCPVGTCRRSFGTSGNLARHKRIHPWLSKPLSCLFDSCRCMFTSDVKLERHLKTHFSEASGHRCMAHACGKAFSTPGNLRRHMRINHSHEAHGSSAAAYCDRLLMKQHPVDLADRAQVSVDGPHHLDSVHTRGVDSAGDQFILQALSSLFDADEIVQFVSF